MKFLAVVLRPRKVSVVHHSVDNWKHGEERINANITPNTIVVKLNNIADLVTEWTVSPLTYDTCYDLSRFLADTFLLMCHLNRFLMWMRALLLLLRHGRRKESYFYRSLSELNTVANHYGAERSTLLCA